MWIQLQDFLQLCVGFPEKKMVSLVKEELRKLGHTSQPPPAALGGLTLLNPALMIFVSIKGLDFSPSDSFPPKSY